MASNQIDETAGPGGIPPGRAPAVFAFESRAIRTLERDGELWVVAKDVAEALGYVWNKHLLDKVPEEWKGVKRIHTPGGVQELAVLSEQGLYFFVARSEAESRSVPEVESPSR